jgi:hypothetical protein
MQHLHIQFPDSDDFKKLLKEIKLEIIKEAKAFEGRNKPTQEYLTRKELCIKYRISLPTLNKLTMLQGLPSIKIGKRRLYSSSAADEYFNTK